MPSGPGTDNFDPGTVVESHRKKIDKSAIFLQNEHIIYFPRPLHSDIQLGHIMGDHGASVGETTHLERRPKRLIQPNDPVLTLPAAERIRYHNVTHIPHERWCRHCVEGRMTKDHSLTVPKEERMVREGVVVQVDFFEYHGLRVMCCCENTSIYIYARVVSDKTYTGAFGPKFHMIANLLEN